MPITTSTTEEVGMAITTYTTAEISDGDKTVDVTYSDDNGFVYKRSVNIPRLESGSVDEETYQAILKSQLKGVNNKLAVGIISTNKKMV